MHPDGVKRLGATLNIDNNVQATVDVDDDAYQPSERRINIGPIYAGEIGGYLVEGTLRLHPEDAVNLYEILGNAIKRQRIEAAPPVAAFGKSEAVTYAWQDFDRHADVTVTPMSGRDALVTFIRRTANQAGGLAGTVIHRPDLPEEKYEAREPGQENGELFDSRLAAVDALVERAY
jgi:hypothetical protein